MLECLKRRAGKLRLFQRNYQLFIRHRSIPVEALANFHNYGMEAFAEKYFADHYEGIRRKRVPLEKMLTWSKVSLA